jgi:hypothetical protein
LTDAQSSLEKTRAGWKATWFATFDVWIVPGVSTMHKDEVLEIVKTEGECANRLQPQKEQAAVKEDGR